MYGQKNYGEKVGNGPYTIAQIGCFVTAFSNLLSRFGITEAPDALNAFFTNNGVYLSDPEDGAGVKDDLAYSSVTRYNGGVVVTGQGGAGWPSSNNAIVKFVYGGGTTHFCLVADHAAGTIVDSWDGVTKKAADTEYGQPVAWATYAGPAVQSVPVPIPASNPGGAYDVVVAVPGYTTANNAANHISQADTVQPGNYAIFNQAAGMINVTSKPGVPGSWINPADNHAAAPAAPAPAPAPAGLPGVGGSYTVNTPIPGYTDSNDAVNHIQSNSTVPAGTYSVFATKYNMLNVTRQAGVPGWWINPGDNGGHGDSSDTAAGDYVAFDEPMALITNKETTDFNLTSGAPATAVAIDTPFVASGKVVLNGTTYFVADAAATTGFKTIDLSPADNPVASDAVASTPTENADGSITIPVNVQSWQTSFQAFMSAQRYVANASIDVEDINDDADDDLNAPQELTKGTLVTVGGKFSRDGVMYYRTATSIAQGKWYGIPVTALTKAGTEEELDEILAELREEDHAAGKVVTSAVTKEKGLVGRLFGKNKGA